MVVLAGTNTLFTYPPEVSVQTTNISVAEVKTATDAAHETADTAPVQPSLPVEQLSPRDKLENPEASVLTAVAPTAHNEVAVEGAAPAPAGVAPTASGGVAETISSDGATSSPPLKDAKFYHERGIAFYHDSDLAAALADFDLAIRNDPNLEGAYIDRGITLYRMREFDLAFADVAQAIRIENSHQQLHRFLRRRPYSHPRIRWPRAVLYGFHSNSGNFATLAAIRRASSRLSSLAAETRRAARARVMYRE